MTNKLSQKASKSKKPSQTKIYRQCACITIKAFDEDKSNIDFREKLRETVCDHLVTMKAPCFLEFGTIRFNKKQNNGVCYAKCKHTKIHQNYFKIIIQDVYGSKTSN